MRIIVSTLALAATLAVPALAQDASTVAYDTTKPSGVMAHLASYKTISGAEKGWKTLSEGYSSVLYFKPDIKAIDLTAKGQWVRLYAQGDEKMMRLLCASLKEKKQYCELHDSSTMKPVK
ncbi:MAG: hypothetical protein HQL39_17860 [Alphaproteobacteria bacterium]|nr:hypothetical protein [Alphaproteobacteria bacterium]